MYSVKTVDKDVELLCVSTWRSRLLNLSTCVPLVDGLLLDTSFPRARGEFLKALHGKRVDQIAHTHSHEDHLGNSAFLAKKFGVPLFAPEKSLPVTRERQRVPLFRHFIWGVPETFEPQILGSEIRTRRFRFTVHPMPGHVDDMVAFFEPERGWLFGGDLFLSVKVRMAADWEDGNAYIASLERAIALRPKIFFCYHQAVVDNPLATLQLKLDFLRETRAGVLELHARGIDEQEIATRLLGPEKRFMRWISEGEFSKLNLVRSYLK